MDFEWDEAKNLVNIAKHGFDFARSRLIFDGRPRLISHHLAVKRFVS